MDKNKHLNNVLYTHKMQHIKDEVSKFLTKKEEITSLLLEKYSAISYAPFMSGSMAKHTATNIKFDFDIVIPFKRNAFASLEDMFNEVYNYLRENLSDDIEVRKQKVSIGITYPADKDNVTVQLDIVPARENKQDEFNETHDLNLYFNDSAWGFSKGSWTKTNIHAQIDHIKGKSDERKVIRLLKIWKKSRGEDYKSFMFELFSVKALDGYSGDSSLWGKLKHVLNYISEHVTDEKYQLIDPGNSNNNVLSNMDTLKRSNLSSTLEVIRKNIEDHPDLYMPYYFPIREEYLPKEEQDKGYGKEEISYPPTAKRFG
ncbi:MAG: hypothetical protein HDS68_10285 [Bacteroidales bacterium]|nr:hypothetical protein [Bacteroidales bacterium]